MPTEQHSLQIAGLSIEVVRKDIKNLHLGVYPPEGRVRVAAPLTVDDEAVRMAVINRLSWIRQQRSRFQLQPRQTERQMVSGETHYLFGTRCRLRFIADTGPARVTLRGKTMLELRARAESTAEQREALLYAFYRAEMKQRVPALLDKWQQVLGVQAEDWGIKRMKTLWGSCNPNARRIWLNLELAKKPLQCLEYILLHELAHLIEPSHNSRFLAILDRHMPTWRLIRDELNGQPMRCERWDH